MGATDAFLQALAGSGKVVKPTGQDRWIAQCPAHDDGKPSLSIARGRGQALAFCFAGCQLADIASALQMRIDDLFDDPRGITYDYMAQGQVVRRVYRTPSKKFRQEIIEQGSGALYAPCDLAAALQNGLPVFIPEGEKDVDALVKFGGVAAVTSAGGALSWAQADWTALAGRSDLTVVADPDEPGMARARQLAAHLQNVTSGVVAVVRAKVGKDAADHLTAGLNVSDFAPVDWQHDPEFESRVDEQREYYRIQRVARERDAAEQAAKVSEQLDPKTLGEILDMSFTEQWVIPDLLERGDRMVITGLEGGGKSYFLRQISVMSAAGVHPFTKEQIEPTKVLVIDAENSERQWSRAGRYVADYAERLGRRSARDNVIVSAGKRIDLNLPDQVNEIHRLIDEHKPDVLQIGPLYKLVGKEITTDTEAAPLIKALDSFRERGLVLLMEAHAGNEGKHNRTLRPRGSSALLGWPEFGFGLLPNEENETFVDLVRWRGDREERKWPSGFRRGFEGELPWEPLRGWGGE
jgi:5S rRNA maturation endonuclease (ribonuclease M5)